MDKKEEKKLPSQRRSDASEFGAWRAMVPGPLVSSSCVGPINNNIRMDAVSDIVPARIRETIAYALNSLENSAPLMHKESVRRVIDVVTIHVDELLSAAIKLGLARDYLATRNSWQENEIFSLRSELYLLRSSSRNQGCPMRDYTLSALDLSILADFSWRLIVSNNNRPPNVLRGDKADPEESDVCLSQLSVMGPPASLMEKSTDCIDRNILVTEILRVEDSIGRISTEISTRTASILDRRHC